MQGGQGIHSTLSPGTVVTAYTVKYDADQTTEDLEELEIRKHLMVCDRQSRKDLVAGLKLGFGYLEDRLLGNCEAPFDCSPAYAVFKLVRAFDPARALELNVSNWIDQLTVILPIAQWNLVAGMKTELPAYLAAAQGSSFDRKDIEVYTTQILSWWRNHCKTFPSWALAARIVFAMTPNSAMCERVFSLLESMFGKDRNSTLSDALQASLMLRFNKRRLG